MNTRSVAAIVFLVSFLQIGIYQWTEIQSLRREIRLLNEAKDILEDQSRDLAMTVTKLTSENDSVATKNFVLGVVSANKSPELYNSVWHDGYERGTQTNQQYTTSEVSPEPPPPR